MSPRHQPHDEWLEADGLGGFASGTVSGERTRRHHALLQSTRRSASGHVALASGFDAWLETADGTRTLSTQRYLPGVLHPDSWSALAGFEPEPWPRWEFRFEDGTRVLQQLFVPKGLPVTVLSFKQLGGPPATLRLRPFLPIGKSLEMPAVRENGQELGFGFGAGEQGLSTRTNGRWHHAPHVYRNFLYVADQAAGLECTGDLGSPGVLEWDLSRGEAFWLLCAGPLPAGLPPLKVETLATGLRATERLRRARFSTPLHRAADAFLVRREQGAGAVGGYPWTADSGRDSLFARRGLCLATGRLADARRILLEWAAEISEATRHHRFAGPADSALWFVIAAGELFDALRRKGRALRSADEQRLWDAVELIVEGHRRGTRHGVRLEDDGLLRAYLPGAGKPVGLQAVWLNALSVAVRRFERLQPELERGLASFEALFWNEEQGFLNSAVDVEHRSGTVDDSFGPEQILAAGGLPLTLLGAVRSRRVIEAVDARLLSPPGLPSLEQETRWLLVPLVEAWLKAEPGEDAPWRARMRFEEPLAAQSGAGNGFVPGSADSNPPRPTHPWPFRAGPVSELLRIQNLLSEEPENG